MSNVKTLNGTLSTVAANASAPSTPTVAIARVLRGLGLKQGRGKDFTVTGYYRRGERLHTYVDACGPHARRVIAEHAGEIEARTDECGFPFTVSIRYSTAGNPFPSVRNGAVEQIRETPPIPETPAIPAAPALPSRTFGALRWECLMPGKHWQFSDDSGTYSLRWYQGRANPRGWYLGRGCSDQWMGLKLTDAATATEKIILREHPSKATA